MTKNLLDKVMNYDLIHITQNYGYSLEIIENNDCFYIWDTRIGTEEEHNLIPIYDYDFDTIEEYIDILRNGKTRHIPCYGLKEFTKEMQLSEILNSEDVLPFEVEVDSNDNKFIVVPYIDIELDKDLSLVEMYREIRNKLVEQAQYIIDNLKPTDPVTKEEWKRLIEKWDNE